MKSFNTDQFRKSFPLLTSNPKIIYFDNACVTLRPTSVLSQIENYYTDFSACHNRSLHELGKKTTKALQEARQTIQKHLQAEDEREIVFTKNTTEGINLLAKGLNLSAGDTVLISDFEHNSNLIPWLYLKQTKGIRLKYFAIPPKATSDQAFENFKNAFKDERIKVVSTFHTSHITGLKLPIKEMCQLTHQQGALFIADAAQALLHTPINVRELDVDFLCLSFHKALGPSGIGALYGKKQLLSELTPLVWGGEMLEDLDGDRITLAPIPARFEAGLQNYSGAMGAAEALKFIANTHKNGSEFYEKELTQSLAENLMKLSGVNILGTSGSIVNLFFDKIDSGELSLLLNQSKSIMARSGVLCAHSWYKKYQIPPSLRLSLAPYNNMKEVNEALTYFHHLSKYY